MALFISSRYKEMTILVEPENVQVGVTGIQRIIPAKFIQFRKGRLQLDEAKEKEKTWAQAIRENVNFNKTIFEVNPAEERERARRREKLNSTEITCPYCEKSFQTIAEIMNHSKVCKEKERADELSANAGRTVRGTATAVAR